MARYTASYEFAQDADLVYGILSDVERMSDFMPLCKRSDVVSRRMTDEAEMVEARLLLRYRRIEFESRVDVTITIWPGARRVGIAAADTGFGSGSARCTVTGVGRSGSRLDVEAEGRPANVMLRLFFGRRLLRVGIDGIVDRVRQRAEELAGW